MQADDRLIQDSIQEEIIKDSDQENIFDDVSQEVKQEIKDEFNQPTAQKSLKSIVENSDGSEFRSEVLDTRPDRDAKTLGGDDIDQRIDRYHGLKLDAAAAPPESLSSDSKVSSVFSKSVGLPRQLTAGLSPTQQQTPIPTLLEWETTRPRTES
jgi:hypothetical protein